MSDIGITLRGNHSGLNASLQKAASAVKKFGDDATKSLRGVQDETRNLHKTLSALGGQMGTALTAAFAVNKVADFTRAIIDAQTNLDKLHNTLSFSLGAGQVTGQMEYLRKTTNALGLEFGSTAVMYAKFAAAARGTSMEGANTQKVFESIGKASTVMGLSASDTQGIMLALTQILSKGTVNAEEIRGQLGERLPGAFAIAARAVGATTAEFSKMLEMGQVISADFLPKFGVQMEKEVAGSFDKASQSMQASLNRMSNAWLEFKQTVAESGVASGIASEIRAVTQYTTVLTDAMLRAKERGAGTAAQLETAFFTALYRIPFDAATSGINNLNKVFNTLTGSVFNFKTNYDLLPTVFETNAKQAELFGARLIGAEKDLSELQAKLALAPENIYLKSEAHQAWLLVQQLKSAIALRDKMSRQSDENGPGNVSGIAAQYPTRSQSYAADAERVNKIRAGYEAVQQGLSGVSANYLKNLAALKAGFDEGMTTQEQYTKDVIALIDKETGFKKTAAKAQSDAAKAQEDARKAAARAEADWQNEVFKAAESEFDARERSIKTLKDQIDKETAHTAALGLSKEAIADLEVATLYETAAAKEQLATRADQIDWSGQMGDKYREEARLLRDLAAAKKAGGIRATEIESQKEAKKYADDMLKEQKRAAEESSKYWEDALMRAFESGKGFFQSLWDTIKNTLKTQVLKVMVQGTMGALGIGATGAAMAGGAGGLDFLNTASSLGNLYGAGASIISLGSQVVAGTMGIANALGTMAANATGTGISGLLAANGAYGTAAAGTASAAAGSVTGALAAIPGWGWAAMGAAALAAIASGRGETRSGATYDTGANGLARYQQGPSGGEIAGSTAQSLFNATKSSIEATLKLVGSRATVTGYTAGLESSGNGKGFAFAGGYVGGTSFGDSAGRNGVLSGQWAYQTMNNEQAMAAYVNELKKSTLEALQAATDVPKLISAQLAGININALDQKGLDTLLESVSGTINAVNTFTQQLNTTAIKELHNLGFAAAAGLIAASGGLDQLQANLGTYYSNFYSAEEQRAQSIKTINAAVQSTGLTLFDAADHTRETFRALMESQNLDTEWGKNAYATLLGVSGAFAELVPAATAATTAIDAVQAATESIADAYTRLTTVLKTNEDIAKERIDLEQQLAALTDTADQALTRQRNALDASNWAIFEQITALKAKKVADEEAAVAAQAAAEAMRIASAAFSATLNTLANSAQQALQTAASNLQAAYSAEASAITATQNRFSGISKSYRDFAAGLMDAVTPPEQSLERLQAQYTRLTDMARLGDADAAIQAVSVGAQLKDSIMARSATGADAALAIARLQVSALATADIAEAQASIAEQSLTALTTQVSALTTLNGSVLGVTAAVAAFQTAQAAYDTAQNQYLLNIALGIAAAYTSGNTSGALGGVGTLVGGSNLTATQVSSALAGTMTADQIDALIGIADVNANGVITAAEVSVASAVQAIAEAQYSLYAPGITASTQAQQTIATGLNSAAAAVSTTAKMVEAIYADLLGRPLSQVEVAAMDAQTGLTVQQIMDSVLSSEEYKVRNTLGTDAQNLLIKQTNAAFGVTTNVAAGASNATSISGSGGVLGAAGSYSAGWAAAELLSASASGNSAAAVIAAAASNYGIGEADVRAVGKSLGLPGYANGGVFSNSVVTRPTNFDRAQMGESGPEAIMPLANINGSLGVRFAGNSANDALVAEIRALRAEVQGLRAEARATATATNKTAKILGRVTQDGDSLTVSTDNSNPIYTVTA